MTDKKKIAIVGVGSPSIQTAIAEFKDRHPEVVIIEATDKMKEAIEGIKQATIETEKFNKTIAELKAIAPIEFENAIMNKPFYHNLPQKKHKRKKK